MHFTSKAILVSACLIAPLRSDAITTGPFHAFLDLLESEEVVPQDARPSLEEVIAPLDRLAPADYADGFGAPNGGDRPSPRALSNALSVPENQRKDTVPLSNLAVAFSQLMASHEIARSPTLPGPENAIDVPVSPDDPIAEVVGGVPVMPQSRSRFEGGTGPGDPRQQVNDITPAFDGSTVYGSDQATEDLLRRLDGSGKLKADENGLLPIINGRPRAGDVRADENTALQALHGLFVKEHNRLVDELSGQCTAAGKTCSGDALYWGARQIVAETQKQIFYDEFLPTFLGTRDLASLVPDQTLLDRFDGAINEFTVAAGRVGHTQVPDTITAGLPGGPIRSDKVEDCLFSRTCVAGASLDALLYGAGRLAAEPIDTVVTDGLRNGQIPGFGSPILIDLFATNINRGRDHGVAGYLAVREALGFAANPLGALLPQSVIDLYGPGASDVDLLVGLFAERRTGAQYLGETGSALWALQFAVLEDIRGPGQTDALLATLLPWVEGVTMEDLILRNTNLGVGAFGENPFLATAPVPPALVALLLGVALLLRVGRSAGRST